MDYRERCYWRWGTSHMNPGHWDPSFGVIAIGQLGPGSLLGLGQGTTGLIAIGPLAVRLRFGLGARFSFVGFSWLLTAYPLPFFYQQNPLAIWTFGFDQFAPALREARVEIEFEI